jgi:hypothetical protein
MVKLVKSKEQVHILEEEQISEGQFFAKDNFEGPHFSESLLTT